MTAQALGKPERNRNRLQIHCCRHQHQRQIALRRNPVRIVLAEAKISRPLISVVPCRVAHMPIRSKAEHRS